MTTKQYSLKAQYRLPAGHQSSEYMDGIYIDGGLFENNIRVLDGVIRMAVTPDAAHGTEHWAAFGFPTYQNGKVVRLGHEFHWRIMDGSAQTYDLRYNGSPYGIGLNTIAAQLYLTPLPILHDIVYDVIYVFILEVG
jgi:hypothetical protein